MKFLKSKTNEPKPVDFQPLESEPAWPASEAKAEELASEQIVVENKPEALLETQPEAPQAEVQRESESLTEAKQNLAEAEGTANAKDAKDFGDVDLSRLLAKAEGTAKAKDAKNFGDADLSKSLATVANDVKNSVNTLPLEARSKISFTIVSCLVLAVVMLGALYALDYLSFDTAESIILQWHISSSD